MLAIILLLCCPLCTQLLHITRTQTQSLLPTVDKNDTIKPPLPLTMSKRDALLLIWTSSCLHSLTHTYPLLTAETQKRGSKCFLQFLDSHVNALKQHRILIMVLDSKEKNCWILDLSVSKLKKTKTKTWLWWDTLQKSFFCTERIREG